MATAQVVDSDAGARVPIPQRRLNCKTTVQGTEEDQPEGDRRRVGGHVQRRT